MEMVRIYVLDNGYQCLLLYTSNLAFNLFFQEEQPLFVKDVSERATCVSRKK